MSELQKILALVEEIRHRLIRVVLVLVPIFAFCITFEIYPGGHGPAARYLPAWLPYPWPSLFYNVTAQIIDWMKGYMLPPGVQLVNIGVGDSVIAQMEVGLLVAVVVGMPWIAHEAGAFLMPALRQNERQLIRSVMVPATVLFVIGFLVGLLWITPFTYLLLFKYVAALGLVPYLSVDAFLEFTLLYTLAFGLVFELPVFVYTLSRLGLVPAHFWRKHWRAAVMGCLVFGMIITPDNSGITMLLIATPMVGLYFGGMLFAERHERKAAAARPMTVPGGAA